MTIGVDAVVQHHCRKSQCIAQLTMFLQIRFQGLVLGVRARQYF